MRGKSIAMLMLALGCGLIASIGITQLLAKRTDSGGKQEMQNVYIAVTDLAVGEKLTAEDVKAEPWPKDKVPPGALSKLEEVEGRRLRVKLFAGEPIIDKKILGKGQNDMGASSSVPKGYRVIPVKVDSVSGGSGLILPGDRVDIMVTLQKNPSKDIQETTTRTILQDIKVFAVNDDVDLSMAEKPKNAKDKSAEARTISLLVTPTQAAKVTLACEMGKIRLVMRGPDDTQATDNAEVKPGELFGRVTSGNREKEYAPKEKKSADTKGGLLDFLNKPKGNVPPPPVAVTTETWTMRILQPTGVNEVVMESTDTKEKKGSWRISESTGVPQGKAGANAGGKKSNAASPVKPQGKSSGTPQTTTGTTTDTAAASSSDSIQNSTDTKTTDATDAGDNALKAQDDAAKNDKNNDKTDTGSKNGDGVPVSDVKPSIDEPDMDDNETGSTDMSANSADTELTPKGKEATSNDKDATPKDQETTPTDEEPAIEPYTVPGSDKTPSDVAPSPADEESSR